MSIKDFIKGFQLRFLQNKTSHVFQLNLSGNVLVLAPHPDDEVFGCGGLIARLVSQGCPPQVAVITGGGASHRTCCSVSEEEIIEARRALTHKAMKSLELPESNIHEFNFPDGGINANAVANNPEIKRLIEDLHPDVILVPHHGEGWPDHLAVHEIGLAVATEGTEVWEYCVWMWYYMQRNLDWSSARKIKMSESEHAKKIKAISDYQSALAPCGKPYIGVLPELFLKANSSDTELFFRIR